MSHIVECFTLQLYKPRDNSSKIPTELYHPGPLVSFQWLLDMVQQRQRLPFEPYVIMKIEAPQAKEKMGKHVKKLSGQRTRFTIRELIKIFKVTNDYPSKKNKNQVYWQRFIKQGVFPGRSVNSVNAQWQRFCHYDTIEQAIIKAYQLGMPYSTSFPQLPSCVRDDFEGRLMQVKGEMGMGNFIPMSNIQSGHQQVRIKTQASFVPKSDFQGPKTEDNVSDARTLNLSKKRVFVPPRVVQEYKYHKYEEKRPRRNSVQSDIELPPLEDFHNKESSSGDVIKVKQEDHDDQRKTAKKKSHSLEPEQKKTADPVPQQSSFVAAL